MTRRTFHQLALSGALAVAAGTVFAQGRVIATTPEAAGPDFAVQGEYAGKAGDQQLGCQVIALGDGKFQAVFHPGGLPGAGWDGKTRIRVDGARDGEETLFGKDAGWKGCLIKDEFTGETDKGALFTLKKVQRKSPTLGSAAPQGAVVIFDGSGTDQLVNGRVTDDGLLREGTQTKKNFKDFTLHAEFLLPFMPSHRGQGRANSGVFLDGRYEIQILDSFGLEGKNNECGGLYSIKPPDVNMCLPPLAWQTYDIDFTAPVFDDQGNKTKSAVVTVRHNGVLIHDKVEIPNSTAGGKEGPVLGPIQFMNHGDPVRFRNIWVVEK